MEEKVIFLRFKEGRTVPVYLEAKSVMKDIAVLIPAYKPSKALIPLLKDLVKAGFDQIIVVNDGSGDEYRPLFSEAEALPQVTLLHHTTNRGKGQALKTGFEYILTHHPEWEGVITADADGQHLPHDILNIARQIKHLNKREVAPSQSYMVLGVRDFSLNHVPWKSRLGNVITRHVFHYFTGEVLTDTQTGLRGFPRHLLPWLIRIEGTRYEYEMNMLAYAKQQGVAIYQVPIKTVYERGNPTSHFKPLQDSYHVYKIFLKFSVPKLAIYGLEIVLFWLLCFLWKDELLSFFIGAAAVIARIGSSLIHYLQNALSSSNSFESISAHRSYGQKAARTLLSAATIQGLYLLMGAGEVLIKLCVDALFFVRRLVAKEK